MLYKHYGRVVCALQTAWDPLREPNAAEKGFTQSPSICTAGADLHWQATPALLRFLDDHEADQNKCCLFNNSTTQCRQAVL